MHSNMIHGKSTLSLYSFFGNVSTIKGFEKDKVVNKKAIVLSWSADTRIEISMQASAIEFKTIINKSFLTQK